MVPSWRPRFRTRSLQRQVKSRKELLPGINETIFGTSHRERQSATAPGCAQCVVCGCVKRRGIGAAGRSAGSRSHGPSSSAGSQVPGTSSSSSSSRGPSRSAGSHSQGASRSTGGRSLGPSSGVGSHSPGPSSSAGGHSLRASSSVGSSSNSSRGPSSKRRDCRRGCDSSDLRVARTRRLERRTSLAALVYARNASAASMVCAMAWVPRRR